MIIPDLKKRAMTVISRRMDKDGKEIAGPAAMQPEIVHKEDGTTDGRHVAMQDFLSAVSEKSPERMMKAMMNFHDLHSLEGNKPEPENE